MGPASAWVTNGYGYNSGYGYTNGYPSTQNAVCYVTTQTYEPDDGYRYPLYYCQSTKSYVYYPVARSTCDDAGLNAKKPGGTSTARRRAQVQSGIRH